MKSKAQSRIYNTYVTEYILKHLHLVKKKIKSQLESGAALEQQPTKDSNQMANKHEKVLNLISHEYSN